MIAKRKGYGDAMSLSSLWANDGAAVPHAGQLALATRDLDHARDHLSAFFADHRLVPQGRAHAIDFRHYHAPLGGLSLNALQYGAAVTVNAPALSDFYLMQFTLAGACEIDCGADAVTLLPGSILVTNPTRPYRKRWSADGRQLIIRLDRALLEDHLARLIGHRPERAVEFTMRPVSGAGVGASVARFAEFIWRDVQQAGAIGTPAVQRAAAEALCAVALTTLDHSYRDALDRPAEPPVPRFIRRAEEYMRAQAGNDITPADIAEAAGVSLRSLHRGFRSFRQTTPAAHLKTLRLDAAHEMLRRGNAASVTEVATACGLTHLGKFARDYRRRFGERPSDTLRRR